MGSRPVHKTPSPWTFKLGTTTTATDVLAPVFVFVSVFVFVFAPAPSPAPQNRRQIAKLPLCHFTIMSHAAMDHGGHGHDGMEDMCSMSMLFTWDTTNLCIVFRQWHVRSTPGLLFSLAAVVVLSMGYEALRALSRQLEARVDRRLSAMPHDEQVTEITPFLAPGSSHPDASRRGHLVKAVFYGLQNLYAFMLM
ncbi:CTR2 long splice variant [Metarhizium album ARSEF 1941]|uniref:Copper transport protein n=1 Tax=Metarhizium album (strain ARSEF 1941) TaxID=1081103 RepID=A0A0B2WSJ2_METAS|nr:CTR2 long splice variant [Metarhizium album ARSEF 1941]KHN96452.1 CTR2 long splice variant [Metarhizium album ARSEF 1941]